MTKINQPPANAFYAPTLLPAIEELLARGIPQDAIEAQFHRSLFDLRTPFMHIPLVLFLLWLLGTTLQYTPPVMPTPAG